MKRIIISLILILCYSITIFAQQKPVAFTHVTVIDATGAAAQPEMTVIISGIQITEIGKTGKVKIPKNADIIDGSGKFLMPGLWDMHTHLDDPELWDLNPPAKKKELSLPVFIANGVTSVRDMGGDIKLLQSWKQRINAGTLLGPRIIACGPMVDGPNPSWGGSIPVSNEAEGRKAVRDVKNLGADFIKIYPGIPRAAYFAIADEAKKLGIPFAGQIPTAVTPAEVSDVGQASEDHIQQMMMALSDREGINAKLKAMREAKTDRSELIRARIEMMLATYDEKKAAELFAKLAKNGTYHTPSLVIWRNYAYFEDDYQKYPDRMKYIPGYLRDYWTFDKNPNLKYRTPERLAAEKKQVKKFIEVVGAMNRAGVQIMTGTDMGANLLQFPGYTVHDELELLVEAGLTPMQAIQAATRSPAKFIGKLDSLGTIEKGKIADLILLDANPLQSISNTQKLNMVIVNGRLLNRRNLDGILNELEKELK